jgi:hypothetical protein
MPTYRGAFKRTHERKDNSKWRCRLYANKKPYRRQLNRKLRYRVRRAEHRVQRGDYGALFPTYKPSVWWEIW